MKAMFTQNEQSALSFHSIIAIFFILFFLLYNNHFIITIFFFEIKHLITKIYSKQFRDYSDLLGMRERGNACNSQELGFV